MLRCFMAIGLCIVFCFSTAAAEGPSWEVQKLEKQLIDRDPKVRAQAAWDLGQIGAVESVPPLTQALEDPSDSVRANAAASLWKLGDAAKPAIPALRKIVNRRDRVLVPQILETLKRLGSRDGSDLTSALSSIQPPVTEAVPVLMALIEARNETTRRGAISALGRMGPASISAVPRLVECLQSHQDADTREKAAEALGQIGPAAAGSAVPALIKAAGDDKWPKVRRASLSALGEMGPAAREAIPVLKEALRDPDNWISLDARNALFRVDPSSREKVAAISESISPWCPASSSRRRDCSARLRERSRTSH